MKVATSIPSTEKSQAITLNFRIPAKYTTNKWSEFSKNFSKSLSNLVLNGERSELNIRDQLILDSMAAKQAIDEKLSIDLANLDKKCTVLKNIKRKNR